MTADTLPDVDCEAMLHAKAGDLSGFDYLMRKHRDPLIRFIVRMVYDSAVAEELAQEVFLRVYLSRGRYEASARFTTWLYRIASRLTLNWIRDHSREKGHVPIGVAVGDMPERQFVDRAPNPDEALEQRTRADRIRAAVHSLPERQRATLLLHKFEGFSCEEIAASMQCSRQAVRSTLFRAYETLRVQLAHLD